MAKNKPGLKVDLMVVSDFAFVGENGKAGIIGLFDMIGVRQFPTGHPELFVVAKLRGEEGARHELVLDLVDPSNESLLKPNPQKMQIQLGGTGGGNIIQRFLNLMFKQPGVHKFRLLEGDEIIGETELSVVRIGDGKVNSGESN